MPVRFLAALVLAIAAKPAQFDDLFMDLETVRGRGARQALGELFSGNFKRVSAALADEKLALMRFADFATGDEGVARFDAMHETVLDEKIERAVNGCGRYAPAFRLECGEQIVGADGLAGGGDERVHLAPQLRKR